VHLLHLVSSEPADKTAGSSKAVTHTDCFLFFIVRSQDFSGAGVQMACFVSRYDCTREVDRWTAGSQENLGAKMRPYFPNRLIMFKPQCAVNGKEVLTADAFSVVLLGPTFPHACKRH